MDRDVFNVGTLARPEQPFVLAAKSLTVFKLRVQLQDVSRSLQVVQLDSRKIQNWIALSLAFKTAFQFPSYYGDNWSALDDCMRDLGWFAGDGIALIFERAETLLVKDPNLRGQLCQALQDYGQYWSEIPNRVDLGKRRPMAFHSIFITSESEPWLKALPRFELTAT